LTYLKARFFYNPELGLVVALQDLAEIMDVMYWIKTPADNTNDMLCRINSALIMAANYGRATFGCMRKLIQKWAAYAKEEEGVDVDLSGMFTYETCIKIGYPEVKIVGRMKERSNESALKIVKEIMSAQTSEPGGKVVRKWAPKSERSSRARRMGARKHYFDDHGYAGGPSDWRAEHMAPERDLDPQSTLEQYVDTDEPMFAMWHDDSDDDDVEDTISYEGDTPESADVDEDEDIAWKWVNKYDRTDIPQDMLDAFTTEQLKVDYWAIRTRTFNQHSWPFKVMDSYVGSISPDAWCFREDKFTEMLEYADCPRREVLVFIWKYTRNLKHALNVELPVVVNSIIDAVMDENYLSYFATMTPDAEWFSEEKLIEYHNEYPGHYSRLLEDFIVGDEDEENKREIEEFHERFGYHQFIAPFHGNVGSWDEVYERMVLQPSDWQAQMDSDMAEKEFCATTTNVDAEPAAMEGGMRQHEMMPMQQMPFALDSNFYRPIVIGQLIWSSSDVSSTLKASYVLPNNWLDNFIQQKLAYWAFMRISYKIKVVVNGTKQHYGRLLFTWLPYGQGISSSYSGYYQAFTGIYYQIDACTDQPLEFIIPWTSPRESVETDQALTLDMVNLSVYVSVPLQCSEGNPAPIYVTITCEPHELNLHGYSLVNGTLAVTKEEQEFREWKKKRQEENWEAQMLNGQGKEQVDSKSILPRALGMLSPPRFF